jgi:8-oxo-dGTP pyrophosphatase MutT (NUDIX family)
VTVIDRRAARVLLVDRAGRALLLHGGDPARQGERWWFTPGGGLQGGETPAEGAARELLEETGLRVDPAELAQPVWQETAEFSWKNQQYRQEQEFFVLRATDTRIDTAGMDADEQQTITEHRWWSAEEIDASDEQIYPATLSDLLRTYASPASASSKPDISPGLDLSFEPTVPSGAGVFSNLGVPSEAGVSAGPGLSDGPGLSAGPGASSGPGVSSGSGVSPGSGDSAVPGAVVLEEGR